MEQLELENRRSSASKTELEEKLRARLGPRLILTLTINRSTMVSYRVQKGVLYLRLHQVFLQAPEPIIEALVAFVHSPQMPGRLARLLDDYIESIRPVARSAKRRVPLTPHGEVHDLKEILQELNQTYFANELQLTITWGKENPRGRRRQRRSTMQMGSYSVDEGLIRIHPALDQTFVPRYYVASVIFHEMLHDIHREPHRAGSRRTIHSKAFRADEERFPDYDRARTWEAKHIRRLLKY